MLTGESKPVNKSVNETFDQDTPLADRKNLLFKDTAILYGRAKALVYSTGANTEIGKISVLLKNTKDQKTPLTTELNNLGKRLSAFAIVAISIIFFLGYLFLDTSLRELFLISISLSVAAIPEGLPAVVTITLAVSVLRLAKHKAIVRKLKSVETLGNVTYILTDKTGTLTENTIAVSDIATETYKKSISEENNYKNLENINEWLINAMILCNDTIISSDNNNIQYLGDPTETSLIKVLTENNVDTQKVSNQFERTFEIPFSSETKKMTVIVQDKLSKKRYVITKGAPEEIEKIINSKNNVADLNNFYTQQGKRTLAFSYKEINLKEELINPEILHKLTDEPSILQDHKFLGIVAQKDPIRKEVKYALQTAYKAGVNTIMITGDHKLTAKSIGIELGLINSEDQVIEGQDLQKIIDNDRTDLNALVQKIKIFARVSPEQKLEIVKAVKAQGHIVATTGDGVNDAPAIKEADIGITMGITGTDVSKEVADMILEDDNYATIVKAIEQGRIIYNNLLKFITYLISCNMSEIFLFILSIVLRLPLPLLPIQLLWVNLVTDGFPALALGADPGEKDIMTRKPQKEYKLVTTKRWGKIILQAFFITLSALFSFILGLNYGYEIAVTMTFTSISITQLLHSLNNKSEHHSIFSKYTEKNLYLRWVIVASISIQLAIVYLPLGNLLLKTVPLTLEQLGISLSFTILPIIASELYKYNTAKTQKVTNTSINFN